MNHVFFLTLVTFFSVQCSTKKKIARKKAGVRDTVASELTGLTSPAAKQSDKGTWQLDKKVELNEQELLKFKVCNKSLLSKGMPCIRFSPKTTNKDWKNALIMSMASHLVYEKVILPSGKKAERKPAHAKRVAKIWGFLDYIPIENKKNDTQVALLPHEDFILVVFRGTETIRDWTNNMNLFRYKSQVFTLLDRLKPMWVHRGFSLGAEGVLLEIEDELDKLKKTYKKELPPLWLAGHSLGGALAAIVGGMLHTRKATYTQKLRHFPYGIYTFGMPKVGSIELRNTVDQMVPNFFRFVMDQDVVVTLPIQKRLRDFNKRKEQEFTWPGKAVFLSNIDCETEDSWYYENNPLKFLRILFQNRQALTDHKMISYISCIHKNLHTETQVQSSLFD